MFDKKIETIEAIIIKLKKLKKTLIIKQLLDKMKKNLKYWLTCLN